MTTPLRASAVCARLAAMAGGAPKNGAVHSVFGSAVNLMVDGALVCLLAAGRALQPYGLVLAAPASFAGLGIQPGQPATLGAGTLTLRAGGGLSIGIQGAEAADLSVEGLAGLNCPTGWDGRMATLAAAITAAPDAAEGLAPLLGALCGGAFPTLPTNHWCNFLLPRVQALPAILRGGSTSALRQAGKGLAGCGPGLTPASDDFLTGLMAALLGVQRAGPAPPFNAATACRALAEGAAPATGAIPAAYLRCAGQGLFNQDILALLAAFLGGDAGTLSAAAGRVVQFGSTSGTDTLAGLWYGLWLCRPAADGPAGV